MDQDLIEALWLCAIVEYKYTECPILLEFPATYFFDIEAL